MKKGFVIKMLSKAAALGMLVSVVCSSNVSAYQSGEALETGIKAQVGYQSGQVSESVPIKSGYMDECNIFRRIAGDVSCNGTVEWNEDIAGWISNVEFNAHVTVDGEEIPVNDTEEVVIHMNVAYKKFEINDSGKYLTAVLTCDEYGDYSVTWSIDK